LTRALLLLAILAAGAQPALAHDGRPAYLELRQTGPEIFDVLWKVPGQGDLRLGIYVELPAGCVNLTEPLAAMIHNAYVERWTVQCTGGLTGGRIVIAGLAATSADVIVRLERMDGSVLVRRLTPSSPAFVVEAAPRALDVAITYVGLGVDHILAGLDHLLFVLALILLTRGGWMLVKTVTAFTVAHSITLTAAALGFVHVPPPPVEAVIALSIVFVASEIVALRRGRAGLTARWPWLVALTFGLLHGLGFAGALSEIGLPQTHIPVALLFFSIGVEAGQFLFIAAVLLLAMLARRMPWRLPKGVSLVPPYAIGSVAAFWFIQRVAAF
jgi:hydrogenase/urease accessory protein HupE